MTETVQNRPDRPHPRASGGTGGPAAESDSTPPRGDWVIAAFMLVFFGLGFVLAQEWPSRAALFPQMVSAAGAVFVVLKLALLTRRTMRARAAGRPEPEPPRVVTPVDAADVAGRDDLPAPATADECLEEDEDASMEYVFATAGRRSWASALAWVTAFFVSFFVLGAFISVPLFALLYLRFAGGSSWRAAAAYAAVTGTLIYVVFAKVVYTALPTGILPLPAL